MFRTCARASAAAASVSHPASHNEEEHSFDVFIYAASVYIFTDSSRAHHIRRHCGGIKHSLGQMGQTAKQQKKKKVILLSISCEAMQHNGTLQDSPQIAHLSRQRCGSWISGGLVVLAEWENHVQPA